MGIHLRTFRLSDSGLFLYVGCFLVLFLNEGGGKFALSCSVPYFSIFDLATFFDQNVTSHPSHLAFLKMKNLLFLGILCQQQITHYNPFLPSMPISIMR